MIPLNAASYTVRRRAPATVVNFKQVNTVESDFTILATIQPIGKEVYSLPVGLRSKVQFKLYTTSVLNLVEAGSQRPNDLVLYQGVWYELYNAEPHNSNAPIPHGKYYMIGPEVA